MMKSFSRRMTSAAILALSVSSSVAFAGSFTAIKDAQCLNGATFGGWKVGGQFNDPNNGVLPDQYTMLARWQGDHILDNLVTYNMGDFTGLYGATQRGFIPQDVNGSPGAQLSCTSFGMLVNTWNNPHRPIVGGGYNDMWGYAWSFANQPHPFIDPATGKSTDLMLQSNIAIAAFSQYPMGHEPNVVGQVVYFAYLRDTTHPSLAPIVFIAEVAGSDWTTSYFNSGHLSYDYGSTANMKAAHDFPNWFPSGGSGSGVWYASGVISNSSSNQNHYITTKYSVGQNNAPMVGHWSSSTPETFWRAHISPTNLFNATTDINTFVKTYGDCSPDGCPAQGYSTLPSDYVLVYAGVLTELTLSNDTFDVSPTNWKLNDTAKDQGSMGVHGDGFGVWRYLPPPDNLTYTWTPTGQLAFTLASAKTVCNTVGGAVPTVAQFNVDKQLATNAGTTIQNLFSVPSQLHWLDNPPASCPATSGTSCNYYQPNANLVGTFPNGSQGYGNSGNGAYVICIT